MTRDSHALKACLSLMPWCLTAVLLVAIPLVAQRGFGPWFVYPFVQLSALPLAWITTLTVCLTCAGIVGGCTTDGVETRGRSLKFLSLALILVILVETTVFVRAGGLLPAHAAGVNASDADVTVLSFNARNTDALSITGAVRTSGADAVLLVEATTEIARGVAERMRRSGSKMQVFTDDGQIGAGAGRVAIMVSESLGTYRMVDAPDLLLGALTVAPKPSTASDHDTGSAPAPVLTAVHSPPPIPGELAASTWRQQLMEATNACKSSAAIVGGDFNASAQHVSAAMGDGCVHAATHLRREAVGTWPASVPAPLGAGIDHQVADGHHWTPAGIQFLEIGDSDHRAVVASYRPVGT